jgi:hypothetical protein
LGLGAARTPLLIYWLFPNTPVAVSGPLAGLTVRTGGAFGAYLWFAGDLWAATNTDQSIASLESQFWTVSGTVQLFDSKKSRSTSQPRPEIGRRNEPGALDRQVRDQASIMQETDGSLPITILKIPDFGEQRIVWSSGKKMSSRELSTSRSRSRYSRRPARACPWQM